MTETEELRVNVEVCRFGLFFLNQMMLPLIPDDLANPWEFSEDSQQRCFLSNPATLGRCEQLQVPAPQSPFVHFI